MDNLLEYILKSNALLTVFFLAYTLLLRKETFFRSNRWFLLFGLLSAVLLPLVTFTKVIWAEPSREITSWTQVGESIPPTVEPIAVDWLLILSCLYGIGMLIFLFQLLLDFKQLQTLLKGKNFEQMQNFKLIAVNEQVAPFSYFNYIVYNAALFDHTELNHILAHERIHCEQKHSIDVLVSRLFCIVFWFNPISWLYRKAMMQNLEFIADTEALKHLDDKKSYQITLLKATTQHSCVAITNPFYQSLIKKRIVMLNKNQSSKLNYWKYLTIIPALAAFLFYFQVKVVAQEKKPENLKKAIFKKEIIAIDINKNSSDDQLKKDAELLKKEHNIKLKFSKVKRNSVGEIVSIKVEYDDSKGSKGVSQYSGDEPIKPFRFYKSDSGAIGFATVSGESKAYVYKFSEDGDEDQAVSVMVFGDDENVIDALEPADAADDEDLQSAPDKEEDADSNTTNKKVIIKKLGNGKDKIQIVVNDKLIDMDMDADKIIAELEPMINSSLSSLEQMHFDFDTKEIGKIKKKAMREARIAIKKAKPDLERARSEIRQTRPEIIKIYGDTENSIDELETAKKEIDAAREELKKARLEIEKSKTELEQLRANQLKDKK